MPLAPTPCMIVPAFALCATLAHAQVVSFDTKRCESGDYRRLGEAHVAFCDGFDNGDGACAVWSGAQKQASDACLAGALMRSQQRIRVQPAVQPETTARAVPARPQTRPSAAICSQTMIDAIGVARIDDVRPVIAARFPEIVVGTTPGSTNMRLDARRSACDDGRLTGVLYDFDGAGVLRDVTFVWTRPSGPAPAPIFTERAGALAKLHGLAPLQSPSRIEGRTSKVRIVVEDAPDRGAVLESYSAPN